jgi:predicted HTH transcriptional regulator
MADLENGLVNRDVIVQPESQIWERKKSLSLSREGMETLCGMLNADDARGSVIFGVDPSGTPVGVEPGDLDSAQRSLQQLIKQKFAPPIQATIKVVQDAEKCFVVVTASRSRSDPYHEFDGRAWIREGTAKRHLSFEEKQSLRKKRDRDSHNGPWKCDKCGSWTGFWSSVVISPTGPQKSYRCKCGGEVWPAT